MIHDGRPEPAANLCCEPVTRVRLSKANATKENVSRSWRNPRRDGEERLCCGAFHDEEVVSLCSSWVVEGGNYARLMPHSLILLSKVL